MAHNPRVNWQVLLDENEWNTDEAVTLPEAQSAPATPGLRSGYGVWIAGTFLALLAAVAGLRLWTQAQAGLAAVETGLGHSLAAEQRAAAESNEVLADALLDPEADLSWRIWLLGQQRQPGEQALVAEIVDFALAGDRAMAQVRLTDPESGAVYRENRFYRETPQGWLRSQPAPKLWGESRSLESEYFVFDYLRLDSPAVVEAAPLLDRAYAHLHREWGQALPVGVSPEEKVAIRVVMRGGSNTPWYTAGEPLTLNSPQLMRLPEGMSEGQALAEAVTFALRREAVTLSERQSYQPALEFLGGMISPMEAQTRSWAGNPMAEPQAPLEYWEAKFFQEEVEGRPFPQTPLEYWQDKFFEQEVGMR